MLEESPYQEKHESRLALIMLILATGAFLAYFLCGSPADKGDRYAIHTPANQTILRDKFFP